MPPSPRHPLPEEPGHLELFPPSPPSPPCLSWVFLEAGRNLGIFLPPPNLGLAKAGLPRRGRPGVSIHGNTALPFFFKSNPLGYSGPLFWQPKPAVLLNPPPPSPSPKQPPPRPRPVLLHLSPAVVTALVLDPIPNPQCCTGNLFQSPGGAVHFLCAQPSEGLTTSLGSPSLMSPTQLFHLASLLSLEHTRGLFLPQGLALASSSAWNALPDICMAFLIHFP